MSNLCAVKMFKKRISLNLVFKPTAPSFVHGHKTAIIQFTLGRWNFTSQNANAHFRNIEFINAMNLINFNMERNQNSTLNQSKSWRMIVYRRESLFNCQLNIMLAIDFPVKCFCDCFSNTQKLNRRLKLIWHLKLSKLRWILLCNFWSQFSFLSWPLWDSNISSTISGC